MFSMNFTLTLVSVIILPITFTFALIYFSKVQKVFTETDEAEGEMTTCLQENLTGIRVVKAFARENMKLNVLINITASIVILSKNYYYMAFFWSSWMYYVYFKSL